MSFTTTAYYRNYETRDPLLQMRNDIALANSNISIGFPAYEVSAAGTQVVPAVNLLNNYIVRTTVNDDLETDTATNIIVALRNKLKSQINQNFNDVGTFPNGTSFTLKVFNNNTGGTITLQAGAGVDFDDTDGDLSNNRATGFMFIVTGQVLLGDAADRITIVNLDY